MANKGTTMKNTTRAFTLRQRRLARKYYNKALTLDFKTTIYQECRNVNTIHNGVSQVINAAGMDKLITVGQRGNHIFIHKINKSLWNKQAKAARKFLTMVK